MVVAGSADDEGLASPLGHERGPRGRWLSGRVEVGEFTYVVCLYVGRALADLAPVGEKPCDQLFTTGGRQGLAVGEDRVPLPLEWYAAEPCHEWFPALATVGADDCVVVVAHQVGPTRGLTALKVRGALGFDHVQGDPQPDRPVGGPAAPNDPGVGVLDGDLVAEEPGRAGTGVGDQRLILR